jgi:hypothetical protein
VLHWGAMRLGGFSLVCCVTVDRRPPSCERFSLGSRPPIRVAAATAVAFAVATAAFLLLALPVAPSRAAPEQLTVTVDRGLSLVGDEVTLTVKGPALAGSSDARLVVRIDGPAAPSEVGQADPQLPAGATLSQQLFPPVRTGPWTVTFALPAGTPAEPGAYLVSVEVTTAGVTLADGTLWLGKAASRQRPLDIAFVWPAALGLHRDSSGAFVDTVLERAVAPSSESPGGLRGLIDLAGRFPGWRFTLAVEPILLTQLRDMADGYARLDSSGAREEVGSDDAAVKNAAQTLAAFKATAASESVEIAVSPYASPDMSVLAAEGWRDGFEQLQLGKQELQQTLSLGSPLAGAYSPDLDLTTGSLAYYGEASIDHVVVDGSLVADLAEPVPYGVVGVRARDTQNDRVTLVFADSRLRSLMGPPWDAGLFFAGLAAELASGDREALVITPGADFELPPDSYLETIGEALGRLGWVNTLTLTELLRAHAPETRPVLFNRVAAGSPGYIEGSLLASLRAAHAAVADLAAAADSTRAPLETARSRASGWPTPSGRGLWLRASWTRWSLWVRARGSSPAAGE